MRSREFSDFLNESGGIEFVWKSHPQTTSWSDGVKIFVQVIKKDGKYEVRAETEDEPLLNEKLAANNRGSWREESPTTQITDTEENAIKLATELLNERDNWFQSNYN